jgi:hypothetical protein
MGQSSGRFVYLQISGVVCRSWNNGREILSPPVREPKIEKVGKYGIGKRSVRLVFANILKFVIDIPLPGKIIFYIYIVEFRVLFAGRGTMQGKS